MWHTIKGGFVGSQSINQSINPHTLNIKKNKEKIGKGEYVEENRDKRSSLHIDPFVGNNNFTFKKKQM